MPAAPSSTDFSRPSDRPCRVLTKPGHAELTRKPSSLQLGREDARDRVQRRLRHAVAGRPAAHLRHAAHAARHVDDARVRALAQQPEQRDRQPVGAVEVRLQRLLDRSKSGCGAGHAEVEADAGVVDEHIEPARVGARPTAAAARCSRGSDTSSVSARTVAPVSPAISLAAAFACVRVARAQQHVIAALRRAGVRPRGRCLDLLLSPTPSPAPCSLIASLSLVLGTASSIPPRARRRGGHRNELHAAADRRRRPRQRRAARARAPLAGDAARRRRRRLRLALRRGDRARARHARRVPPRRSTSTTARRTSPCSRRPCATPTTASSSPRACARTTAWTRACCAARKRRS